MCTAHCLLAVAASPFKVSCKLNHLFIFFSEHSQHHEIVERGNEHAEADSFVPRTKGETLYQVERHNIIKLIIE